MRSRSPATPDTTVDAAPPEVPLNDVIEAHDLTVGYGTRSVLERVNLALRRGEVTALIGPNGSGKSTLLRTLVRLLQPTGGSVLLDGQAINELSTREVARQMAALPQQPEVPAGLTVVELVEQGRYPHRGPLQTFGVADREAVNRALEETGMTAFQNRALDELSGGERQRAWIALALAQDTPILLLDEPTTFLDLGHQFEVLELIGRLRARNGLTVVLVLHDINQAARHADRIVALDQGAIVADGPPAEVITQGLLHEVFRVHADVFIGPDAIPVSTPTRWAGSRPPTEPNPGSSDR